MKAQIIVDDLNSQRKRVLVQADDGTMIEFSSNPKTGDVQSWVKLIAKEPYFHISVMDSYGKQLTRGINLKKKDRTGLFLFLLFITCSIAALFYKDVLKAISYLLGQP